MPIDVDDFVPPPSDQDDDLQNDEIFEEQKPKKRGRSSRDVELTLLQGELYVICKLHTICLNDLLSTPPRSSLFNQP